MKKLSHKYKLIIIALILVGGIFVLSKKTSAQAKLPLVVAPARQTIQINPGETESSMIKFFNQGDTSVSGNIKAVDFIVENNEGSPILLEDITTLSRFSAASWIKLPYEKATITPNDKLQIPFKIEAPQNARPGGRYVAIYFEAVGQIPSIPELKATKTGILSTGSRIVGLVYIRVNGPITENAIVEKFDVPRFIEYGPVDIQAEILNRSDYHITPKGQITLSNWFGKTIDQKVLEEKNIFPDASRVYNAKLGGKILIGKYKVQLISGFGKQGKTLTSTASFWAFPVRIALIIILTITIITLLTILIWKKLKKRQKKIEKKLEAEVSELEELKKKYKDNPPIK